MSELKFRHEWKYEINRMDMLILRQRLLAVAGHDEHAVDGIYRIRSLYFDDPTDRALREKIDGVNIRSKFRIRYYDGNTDFIRLEKKSKVNGLCNKQSTGLTREQAQAIALGQTDRMKDAAEPLVRELYLEMKNKGLRPRTVVDYTREAFVYKPGNVRCTLDYNIRTGLNCVDFLNTEMVTIPAGDPVILLEVKWDEFLPSVIRDAVSLEGRRVGAFSKYAACRIYG